MKKENIREKVAIIEDGQRGSKVWVMGVHKEDNQNLVPIIMFKKDV